MAKFASVLKGSVEPAKNFADSLSGIVQGSFGNVKAMQLALTSYLLTGLSVLSDAGSSTKESPGFMDLPKSARRKAIEDGGFQEIFNSVKALSATAFDQLQPSQVGIAKNQLSQMIGPWLAIAQVVYLGSRSQVAELLNALANGPENSSGEATDPSFSNLAKVARDIRLDLILAEEGLHFTATTGEVFSKDQLRQLIEAEAKIAESHKELKSQVAFVHKGLSKALNKRYPFMVKSTPKSEATKALKAVDANDVETLAQIKKLASEAVAK